MEITTKRTTSLKPYLGGLKKDREAKIKAPEKN